MSLWSVLGVLGGLIILGIGVTAWIAWRIARGAPEGR